MPRRRFNLTAEDKERNASADAALRARRAEQQRARRAAQKDLRTVQHDDHNTNNNVAVPRSKVDTPSLGENSNNVVARPQRSPVRLSTRSPRGSRAQDPINDITDTLDDFSLSEANPYTSIQSSSAHRRTTTHNLLRSSNYESGQTDSETDTDAIRTIRIRVSQSPTKASTFRQDLTAPLIAPAVPSQTHASAVPKQLTAISTLNLTTTQTVPRSIIATASLPLPIAPAPPFPQRTTVADPSQIATASSPDEIATTSVPSQLPTVSDPSQNATISDSEDEDPGSPFDFPTSPAQNSDDDMGYQIEGHHEEFQDEGHRGQGYATDTIAEDTPEAAAETGPAKERGHNEEITTENIVELETGDQGNVNDETFIQPIEESEHHEDSVAETDERDNTITEESARQYAKDCIESTMSYGGCHCPNHWKDRPTAACEPVHTSEIRVGNLRSFIETWQGIPNRLTTKDLLNLETPGIPSTTQLSNSGQEDSSTIGAATDTLPDWRLWYQGGDNPMALSLEDSQCADAATIPIRRRYDIDAFLCGVDSLAAFREGFHIVYYPRYTKTIKNDTYVKFRNQRLKDCKHYRFGEGHEVRGWATYICFPNLPININKLDHPPHLTDYEIGLWTDGILLPAIREVCDFETQQRHPKNSAEARFKARAAQGERTSAQDKRQIETFHFLDASVLGPLWESIQRRLQGVGGELAKFEGAFLVTLHYDCKLQFRQSSVALVRDQFNAFLDAKFYREHLNLEESWLDLAWEDVPQRAGVTLLWKSYCARAILDALKINSADEYPWHGLRDAGGCRQKVRDQSTLRLGGAVFVQVYAVAKELWTGPLKDHHLFHSTDFDALPLSEQTIAQYFENNVPGSSTRRDNGTRRLRIRSAFGQSKERAWATLQGASSATFGVRTEFRISWVLFQEIESPLLPAADENTISDGNHSSFWVLPTAVLNTFTALSLNRIVYGIEHLTARLRFEGGTPDIEEQVANSTMCTLLCQWLRMIAANQHPRRENRLWKERYKGRANTEGPRPDRRGANFSASWTLYGVLYLPDELFNWSDLHFRADVVQQTTFVHNSFRSSFRNYGRQEGSDQYSTFLQEKARELQACDLRLKANPRDRKATSSSRQIMQLLYESVFQSYAKHILERLKGEVNPENRLSYNEAEGYSGLNGWLICKAEGKDPYIAYPTGSRKKTPAGQVKQVAVSSFAKTWEARIQLLFDWDNGFVPVWNGTPFRKRAKLCYNTVRDTLGIAKAEVFRKNFGKNAGPYLSMVPIFESGTLHRKQKASKVNKKSVRESRLAGGARTVWICAYATGETNPKWHLVDNAEKSWRDSDYTPEPMKDLLAQLPPRTLPSESEAVPLSGSEAAPPSENEAPQQTGRPRRNIPRAKIPSETSSSRSTSSTQEPPGRRRRPATRAQPKINHIESIQPAETTTRRRTRQRKEKGSDPVLELSLLSLGQDSLPGSSAQTEPENTRQRNIYINPRRDNGYQQQMIAVVINKSQAGQSAL